jgi:hypothetical protein
MENKDDAAAVLPQILGVLRELLEHARTESQMRQTEALKGLAEMRAMQAEAKTKAAEAQAAAR